MKIKNTFHRGFTLIELMIVIVILGILMGTILPRLTGAQSRARDTARMADLTNIAQALEVYYNDNGQYPDADVVDFSSVDGANTNCLEDGHVSADAVGAYLKGDKIIEPSSDNLNSVGCIGAYYYKPLLRKGVPNAAYVLASDVETYQTANFVISDKNNDSLFTNYTDVVGLIGVGDFETADETNALTTIYVLTP